MEPKITNKDVWEGESSKVKQDSAIIDAYLYFELPE